MHIEFSAHFENDLKSIISCLPIDAHLFNSFNSTGETVVLSGERDQLEKVLEASEDDISKQKIDNSKELIESFRKIKAIIKGHLK